MKYPESVETVVSKKFGKLEKNTACFVCNRFMKIGQDAVLVVSEYEGDLTTIGMHTECSDFNDFVNLLLSGEVDLD